MQPTASRSQFIIVAAPIVIVLLVIVAAYLSFRQSRFGHGSVMIGDSLSIQVDVANNDKTREKGLSGRARLGPDDGMLFLFPSEARYGFWMKGMRFPIDIVWIRKGEIVDLTTSVPPPAKGQTELPSYFPMGMVDAVLELPAGFAQAHGLRSGLVVKYVH